MWVYLHTLQRSTQLSCVAVLGRNMLNRRLTWLTEVRELAPLFQLLNAWVLPCSGKAGLLVSRATDDSTTAKGGDHWGVVCVNIYWMDHWTFLSCRSGLYLKYFAFQMAALAKLSKQLCPVIPSAVEKNYCHYALWNIIILNLCVRLMAWVNSGIIFCGANSLVNVTCIQLLYTSHHHHDQNAFLAQAIRLESKWA